MHKAIEASSKDWPEDITWLRRLAGTLVRDQDSAEDLAQDVLLSTLSNPPALHIPWRKAVAARARNRVRSLYKAGANRTAREAHVARSEVVEDAAEETTRLYHVSQTVLQLVAEAPEPYCTVIRLRYLDDLMPKEIALRLGRPIHTVKTQLKRGLELIRQELDRRHGGDRRSWVSALLPMAYPLHEPVWRAKWFAGTGVVVAIGIVTVSIMMLDPISTPVPLTTALEGSNVNSDSSLTVPENGLVALDQENPRKRVDTNGKREQQIRVVDEATQSAVADAEVRFFPLPDTPEAAALAQDWFRWGVLEERTAEHSESARTDESGSVRFDHTGRGFVVIASAPPMWGWAVAKATDGSSLTLEVRNDSDAEVQVLDVRSAPVAGVRVQLESIGYCGEDGDDGAYLCSTTDHDKGIATLRHAGYIKGSRESPCHATAVVRCGIAGFGSTRGSRLDSAKVGSGNPRERMIVALEAEIGLCEVSVVDHEGLPVHEKAWIQMSGHGDVNPDVELEVRNGVALVPVATGGTLWIRAYSSTYGAREITVPGPSKPDETVRAVVQPQSEVVRVSGRLVDSSGTVIPSVDLVCSIGQPEEIRRRLRGEQSCTTTDEGRFSFQAAEAPTADDKVRVYQLGPDGAPIAVARCQPSLNGNFVELGDVQVTALPVVVAGRVLDSSGNAVSGAKLTLVQRRDEVVEWQEWRGRAPLSRADGSFEFVGEREEFSSELELFASRSGLGTGELRVEGNPLDLTLRLEKAITLEGQVLIHESMHSARLYVSARPKTASIPATTLPGQYSEFGGATQVLGRDGIFKLRGLSVGEYVLSVARHIAYDESILFGRELALDQVGVGQPPFLSIDLSSYTYRSIKLVDESGRPVSDALVEVDSPGTEESAGYLCDVAGEYSFLVDAASGSHRVSIASRRDDTLNLVTIDPAEGEEFAFVQAPFPITIALTGERPQLSDQCELWLVFEEPLEPQTQYGEVRVESDFTARCDAPIMGALPFRFDVRRRTAANGQWASEQVESKADRRIELTPTMRNGTVQVPAPPTEKVEAALLRLKNR